MGKENIQTIHKRRYTTCKKHKQHTSTSQVINEMQNNEIYFSYETKKVFKNIIILKTNKGAENQFQSYTAVEKTLMMQLDNINPELYISHVF